MIAAALGTLLVLAASPRERIRFDDGWRFLRMPTLEGEARLGPYRWEWKLGTEADFGKTTLPDDLNQGRWQETRLGLSVLTRRQYGWFRAELGADPDGARKLLHFDSTDEDAMVWLNGKYLGTHLGFATEFEFPVGTAWNPSGPNRLVVLIKNWAQGGGIDGGVTLVEPETDTVPAQAAPEFDDRTWRSVHLPHDYVIEGRFDLYGDNSHGSLPKPIGFYRKTFVPPVSMKGKAVWLEFDGVYRNADVYLNGEHVHHQKSGYVGFRVDLASRLRYGQPNVLTVRTDPRKNEGWWYEGGGIYRHVWLNVADPFHFEPDGVFVRTEVAKDKAIIRAQMDLIERSEGAQVQVRVLDPKGKVVASSLEPLETIRHETSLTVDRPQLWDLDHPHLYRLEATILDAGQVRDQVTVPFGIRTLRWDKDQGFFLNGKAVKLQGTSNHQDHAGVGVALPDGLIEWRLKLLKSMGANAYRTAHNMVAPELLDACDRLGILVLDEMRHFGDTHDSKSKPGTRAEALDDLHYQVKHDRNHPSVIAWSLYNEEPLQGTPEGTEIFKKMRAVVDKLDGTRRCTGATNDGFEHGVIDATQLFGINYNIDAYDKVRAARPDLPLFGSETGSAVSTRGIYENDPKRGYVGAYDNNRASFGNFAEEAWKAVATRPWMAGAFVWTGFDYKGEPTPYGWPCINSHFGIIDIAGFPKDTFWYYQAWWGKKPVVHVFPHWNWAGKEGQNVDVWVHSNADEVDLLLNGKPLGKKTMERLGHLEWKVPYIPGKLEAVGYRNGKVIARDLVSTTGAPAAIRLKTDRTKILADHEDLTIVQVEVVDAQGRVVPTADHRIQFSVTGAASIGGVGNGDPSDHDPDKAMNRKAFNGLCMALVQSNGKRGTIQFKATAPGLKSATLRLSAETTAARP